jgi:hypothetical protein
MSANNEQDKTVFQTPNPTELKKATEQDPIHKREGAVEADVASPEQNSDEEAAQMGREASADMANSQTTIANLGGH